MSRAQDWRWCSLWRRLNVDADVANDIVARDGADDGGEAPSLPPLSPWPVDEPIDWVRWVNRAETPAELETLRQSIRRGRPFGSPAWQTRTAKQLNLESTFKPRGRPRKRAGEKG